MARKSLGTAGRTPGTSPSNFGSEAAAAAWVRRAPSLGGQVARHKEPTPSSAPHVNRHQRHPSRWKNSFPLTAPTRAQLRVQKGEPASPSLRCLLPLILCNWLLPSTNNLISLLPWLRSLHTFPAHQDFPLREFQIPSGVSKLSFFHPRWENNQGTHGGGFHMTVST